MTRKDRIELMAEIERFTIICLTNNLGRPMDNLTIFDQLGIYSIQDFHQSMWNSISEGRLEVTPDWKLRLPD